MSKFVGQGLVGMTLEPAREGEEPPINKKVRKVDLEKEVKK